MQVLGTSLARALAPSLWGILRTHGGQIRVQLEERSILSYVGIKEIESNLEHLC